MILIITMILIWAGAAGMIWRTHRVHAYRVKYILPRVSGAARCDIETDVMHADWMWRYKAIDRVSFEAMVWNFWRPLDSFYPDDAFMRCKAHNTYHLREEFTA